MKQKTPKQIGFKVIKEEWNKYELEDGTILETKAVMIDVVRADKYDQMTANPLYGAKFTNIIKITCPDKLKNKDAVKKKERDPSVI